MKNTQIESGFTYFDIPKATRCHGITRIKVEVCPGGLETAAECYKQQACVKGRHLTFALT